VICVSWNQKAEIYLLGAEGKEVRLGRKKKFFRVKKSESEGCGK
jgi:hypothetical protein